MSGQEWVEKVAYDACLNKLNDCRSENAELCRKLEEAEAKLKWIEEVTDDIMAEKCPTDEVHCTCVPPLRAELSRLKRETVRVDVLVRWIDSVIPYAGSYTTCDQLWRLLRARLSRLEEKHDPT